MKASTINRWPEESRTTINCIDDVSTGGGGVNGHLIDAGLATVPPPGMGKNLNLASHVLRIPPSQNPDHLFDIAQFQTGGTSGDFYGCQIEPTLLFCSRGQVSLELTRLSSLFFSSSRHISNKFRIHKMCLMYFQLEFTKWRRLANKSELRNGNTVSFSIQVSVKQ